MDEWKVLSVCAVMAIVAYASDLPTGTFIEGDPGDVVAAKRGSRIHLAVSMPSLRTASSGKSFSEWIDEKVRDEIDNGSD